MKLPQTILRGTMHTIAIAVVCTAVALYLVVHSILAGSIVKDNFCEMMSKQLQTRVTVEGGIDVDWLNQVVINNLTIYDQQDDTLLYARRTLVAYEIMPLLRHHLILSTCQLIDFDLHAWRNAGAQTSNYQFAIDALMHKDNPDEQPYFQQVDLNTIHLHQGRLSYHVIDQPMSADLPIDPNHIEISQLGANIHIHDKELLINRFRCQEHATAIEAHQLKMALNVREAFDSPSGEHKFIALLRNLHVTGPDLMARIDAESTSDQITLNIRQLDLPNGLPTLPGIRQLHAAATLNVYQLRNPLDSLYLTLDVGDLQFDADRLGHLRLKGDLEGMPCEAELKNCQLSSSHGEAYLTASLLSPRPEDGSMDFSRREYYLTGNCSTNGIELGRLTPKSAQLGQLKLHMDFELKHRPDHPLQLACQGTLPRLDWHGHSYSDITLNCQGQPRKLSGDVAFSDSLGTLAARFDYDLTRTRAQYHLDGTLSHLNPHGLALTNVERLDSLELSADIHADIQARRWQDADFDILLQDVCLNKGEKQLELGDISCKGSPRNGSLSSQLVNLYYNQRKSAHRNYYVEGKVLPANELLAMLDYDVTMNEPVEFMALTDSLRSLKRLHINVPKLVVEDNLHLTTTLDMKDDAQGILHPVLDFEVSTDKHRMAGTVEGHIDPEPLEINIDPAIILYNKEKLQLHHTRIVRNEQGNIELQHFSVTGANQEISASGVFGQDNDRSLSVQLKNFDLAPILLTLPRGYIHFGGHVTGELALTGGPEMHLRADSLQICDFSYIGELLGDAVMHVDYNLDDSQVELLCDVVSGQKYNSHIRCDLALGRQKSMDLLVQPDHLPLGFIKYWVGGILQDFTGTVTGDVRLYGDMDHLQLAGTPVVDGLFTHDIIGSHFHFNDTVKLSPGLILLDNITMDDCHGHSLQARAKVNHEFLHDFVYDVNINMPKASQGFLALDRQPADGRMYWGQLYAQGTAHLYGGNGKHRMNLRVGTTDKSWFYLSPSAQDVNPDQAAYGFLTFRDKTMRDMESAQHSEMPLGDENNAPTDLEVNILLEATDQCEVTVQMDPMSEDLLKGRGHGNLSIVYNPSRDIRLSGEYQIAQGTYTMNIKPDLMRKEFQLRNTSNVKFSGVPSEADLNLDAYYNIPSVNLTDLGPGITSLGSSNRRSAPVDCNMAVTGHLSSPQVRFGLDLRNVSDDINTKVHNIIGTEEMINQEVLYLLLFSKFYTPQNVVLEETHTGSEVTAFASASITSQINELLGHVSDSFRMGTNVRTDRGDFTDMEMDLTLSTRLLGDRLLLNGNVGYRDPASRLSTLGSNNAFIGDFDVEWLMTESGKLRLKAFSHYNERDYSINNALSTQGASLIIRHDFFGWRDMWPWSKKAVK